MKLNLEFVRDCATAVLWRIEDLLMNERISFENAKARAIKEAEPVWRGLDPDTRADVRAVAHSLERGDLSPTVRRLLDDRILKDIEELRGWPAGRIERWFYYLTGLVFRT